MINPKISIIVPVYKVEKHIRQCITSVISQTYKNFELLLIDDGSPDKSGEICDEYANQDRRIKVYHKENGGVSSARNVGLKEMTGEWVCFLDSDDWWESSFLYTFVEIINASGCDIVLQGYIEENEINGTQNIVSLPKCHFNTASELIVFLENAKGVHNGFLWHRIFKADIFREYNITFPIGISFAEDGDVFFRYMKYATSSIITSQYGYHYRKAEGTLTSTGNTVSDKIFCHLIESYASNLCDIINKENPSGIIINSIKLYIWRLLSAWHIERCITNYSTYQKKLLYIQDLIVKYHLNQTDGMPYSIKVLSTTCLKPAALYNMRLLWLIIKYRELIQRIKNKI